MSKVLFKTKFPVQFHGSKKNGKQISFNKSTGSRFIRTNDRVKSLENWLTVKLTAEKVKQRIDTINEFVNIKFTFYFPKTVFFTKKGERNKKVPDISNLYELPQDVMQAVGILDNDYLVEGHDGSRRLPIDDTAYILEIEITSI